MLKSTVSTACAGNDGSSQVRRAGMTGRDGRKPVFQELLHPTGRGSEIIKDVQNRESFHSNNESQVFFIEKTVKCGVEKLSRLHIYNTLNPQRKTS